MNNTQDGRYDCNGRSVRHIRGQVRRPSDQKLSPGNGKMLTVWACNAFQTMLNAQEYRQTLYRRGNVVWTSPGAVDAQES